MSRAVSSSFLSLVFLSFAAGSALAGSTGSSALGQGPVATGPARPVAAPIRTFSREREAAPRIDGFYSTPVWRTEQTIVVVTPEQSRQAPVTMLSGNPIDPGATISRTPSGSVVIGPPPNLIFVAPLPQAARPYAPPEFHMIGAPSARNMGRP